MIASLVNQVRDGDTQAYAELVRRFQDAVYATAYQATLDADAARDITQETFVRAYERLASLRDTDAFPGWVVRIARNLALNWNRSPERAGLPLDEVAGSTPDPSASVATRDLVARALSALPHDNRLALALHLVDGYSYAEVAHMLGATASTVRGRVARARQAMQREMLTMVEETLKGDAPDEESAVETAKRAVEAAQTALDSRDLPAATDLAETALAELRALRAQDVQQRGLAYNATHILFHSLHATDHTRWREVMREGVRLAEQAGDVAEAGQLLWMIAMYDLELTQPERDELFSDAIALMERSVGGLEPWHGPYGELRDATQRGDVAGCTDVLARLREGAAKMGRLPVLALFDAWDELLRLVGPRPDVTRRVFWAVGATPLRVEEGRVRVGELSDPSLFPLSGYTMMGAAMGELAKCVSGFELLHWVRWLPCDEVEVGHEETLVTRSNSPNPTQTRVWVEADDASVETPAGRFDNCLLVRATVTRSPQDELIHLPDGAYDYTLALSGERWCWLARGVGPVAYRHERADGIVEHALLSSFHSPERTEEWLPLSVGTRWEYKPAEPAPTFDPAIRAWISGVDGEGHSLLSWVSVAMRTDASREG